MSIDEVIVSLRNSASKAFDYKWQREQYQIANWLEELKVYQQHEIICNKGYNAGYNKAIDDFVAFTKEHEYKYGNADITSIVNEFIVEHLKVGGTK